MKKCMIIFSWIALILLFHPADGQCLQANLRGRLETNYVIRDTDGFQYGFLDKTDSVQWRNMLKFDLEIKPEYKGLPPACRLEKLFLTYRGAYDAIYDLRDRYDNLMEKSPDDFVFGKDDVETENDLREAFVDLVGEHGSQTVNLRLGRQIVQWGEADGFNLMNVLCPSDYSYQMFFSDPDDTATPLWMARLDYTIVGAGIFDFIGLELLGIPDIRPTQFAPMTDENGNFTSIAPYGIGFQDFEGFSDLVMLATDTGLFLAGLPGPFQDPYLIGYTPPVLTNQQRIQGALKYTEDDPANNLDNMEYGASLLFGIGNLETTLHYFVGFQDDPAVDTSDATRFGLAYGAYAYDQYAFGGLGGTPFPNGPTAVFTHPRQRTYGLSFNYFMQWANAVFRGEGSMTDKMHLTYLMDPSGKGIDSKKVYQSLLAIDKDLHPKWIGTTSAVIWNLQGYWRHVAGLDDSEVFMHRVFGPAGRAYPQDKQDSYRITMNIQTDYHHGQIVPACFAMYDPTGTWMTNAYVKYIMDNHWVFQLTEQSFWGNKNAVSRFAGLIDESELSFKIMYRF